MGCGCSNRYDQVYLETDQLGGQIGESLPPPCRIAPLDDDVLALYPAEFAEALPERLDVPQAIWGARRAGPEIADAVAVPWLLRVHGKRRREESQRKSEATSPLNAAARRPGRHAQRLHSA